MKSAGSVSPLFLFFLMISVNCFAQLRQLYKDSDENNSIADISFYTPKEGYVGFKDWIGYTSDTGKTLSKNSLLLRMMI
jgi:hypothetical protein